jgi:deazaflavin-dependent oxidoreductase (nitroreductase family)
MSHNRIRTFNKHITNRITRRFASSSRGPFAVIRHVGRRSGKPYETMLMIWPVGDDFVIVLTYGPEVDWYRNLLAAEHASVLWHRKVYAIEKPEPLEKATAMTAFPPFIRQILGRLSVQDFVRVKRHVIEPTLEAANAWHISDSAGESRGEAK